MKPKKRAKKAVTLLTKIETLLSDVLDECVDIEKTVGKNVREVLLSAQSSISSAIDYFSGTPAPAAPLTPAKTKAKAPAKKKAPAKAKKRAPAPSVRKRALKA